MANNQAVLVTYLKDILMSEEKAVIAVAKREHIFEMRDKDQTSLGFISVFDLKAYVFENEEEASDYVVRNIDGTEWTQVFEHPLFQRRKPQLISAATLNPEDDQQFYVLMHGQKTGPYEKYEINTMLEEKEILLTDMVSTNAGHTWTKLFQIDNFDRRILKEADKLPGVPTEAMQANDSVIAINPATEAMSSLAYLSNVKRGKSVERDKVQFYESDKNVKSNNSSIYKWLLVGSVLGIGYFLFHIKNQLNSPFKDGSPAIGEQAQMLTPVEMNSPSNGAQNSGSKLGERSRGTQVNDQGRSGGKFESRTMQPIRPNSRKSFMESGKYQAIKTNPDGSSEDPNYFYDNTSAMELDPVRSQVSKENFDNSANEGEGPIPSSDNLFESEVSN